MRRRGSSGAGKASEEVMESAAELHEARVLRAGIEVKEAELARLSAPPGEASEASPDVRALLAAEIDRLKSDYRRILARQADQDYCRRRAEWRAQRGTARGCERDRNSACA
ncbi:MAG: hypothetical protein NEA02_05635 [Thermoanaerobaculia bacterium]|nr:hypothetical protein [Thermoanaerobaculia bacterium]